MSINIPIIHEKIVVMGLLTLPITKDWKKVHQSNQNQDKINLPQYS